MTKKKKHSIKVAKNSNHSARARPISDPVPCGSLCSASSNDNTYKTSLCTAIARIQGVSSGTDGFSSQITELNTEVNKLTDGIKKDALQLLVNVFSDFLTLYTDCSAKVTFLNKDFCTTINWGGCKPPCVLGRSNLYDLLNQEPSKVSGFSTWDKLYEPNMKAMLFSHSSGSGKSFAQALTDLGKSGSPAANPFLDAKGASLCTGMSGVDPNTGAPDGIMPFFNFQYHFRTIYSNIKKLIPEVLAADAIYCDISDDTGSFQAMNCTCGSTCCDLSNIINNKTNKNVDSQKVTEIAMQLGLTMQSLSKVKIPKYSLPMLQTLELVNSSFTEVPSDLTNLVALTNLSLAVNSITEWSNLANLTGLEILDISDNSLTAVPDELTKLGSLTALYLARNQINADTGWSNLANLTGLTNLDIGGNSLTAVPDELTKLGSLTVLVLENNNITDWSNLANLTGLELLNISNNSLTTMPDELAKLPALTVLSSGSNIITDWSCLSKLTGLIQLNISYTHLKSVPHALSNLSKLLVLILGGNQITDWSNLAKLTGLKFLDISYNKLGTVPSEFANLSLQQVNLNNNNIDKWDSALSLTQLKDLTCVNIAYNPNNSCTSLSGKNCLKCSDVPAKYTALKNSCIESDHTC